MNSVSYRIYRIEQSVKTYSRTRHLHWSYKSSGEEVDKEVQSILNEMRNNGLRFRLEGRKLQVFGSVPDWLVMRIEKHSDLLKEALQPPSFKEWWKWVQTPYGPARIVDTPLKNDEIAVQYMWHIGLVWLKKNEWDIYRGGECTN
jgi:hypothetical protein